MQRYTAFKRRQLNILLMNLLDPAAAKADVLQVVVRHLFILRQRFPAHMHMILLPHRTSPVTPPASERQPPLAESSLFSSLQPLRENEKPASYFMLPGEKYKAKTKLSIKQGS